MPINTIMYHYVRNNEDFFYDTYCRRKNEFESQIDFFIKDSSILNPKDSEKLIYFLKSKDKYCYLLTFDDGYKDHFYCAEYLAKKKISAFFFPPINILNKNLLDVNAIHILIGMRGVEVSKLLKEIEKICINSCFLLRNNNQEVNIQTYLEDFNLKILYDDRETLMFKRILQKDLIGEQNRKLIIDILLKKYTGKESSQIANNLYLNVKELEEMKKMGMLFGSHGNTHRWLNTLDYFEQKDEIENSFISLQKMDIISKDDPITMCYPFGAFNNETIKILNDLKADIGFTTGDGISKLKQEKESIFKLFRWDTNHFWDNKWRRPSIPHKI